MLPLVVRGKVESSPTTNTYLRTTCCCAAFGAQSPDREAYPIPSLRSYRRLTGVTESQPFLGWLISFYLPLELVGASSFLTTRDLLVLSNRSFFLGRQE